MEHGNCAKRGFAWTTLALIGILGGTTVVGCAVGPYTGLVKTGATQGATFNFWGQTDSAAPALTAQILTSPGGDWHIGPFTNITPNGGVPVSGPYNDPYDSVPYYTFNFYSKAVSSAQWPAGGLARLKLRGKFNGSSTVGDMYSFDNEGMDCLTSQPAGTGWRTKGMNCRSPYLGSKLITVVSPTPTPADVRGTEIQYLGRGAGHAFLSDDPSDPAEDQDPQDHEAETLNYYEQIDAPDTLDLFKSRFGFPNGYPGAEVHAIYYNRGDLGLARDMHCKKSAPAIQPIPPKPVVTACYVTNYGRSSVIDGNAPVFGLPFNTAIDQAIDGFQTGVTRAIATVAMVHDAANVDNPIQFMVYDDAGILDPYAALDNPGLFALADTEADPFNNVHVGSNANINVPDNCLTCHGASSSYARAESGPVSVQGAAFLPFDPDSMDFSTTNSTYSKNNMLAPLKALNALVWDTSPPLGVVELLKGMYPASSGSPGPKNTTASFEPNFIPTAWQSSDKVANQVYKEVVKPYCRTCHVTAFSGLDWDSFTEFQDESPFMLDELCSNTKRLVMPQAEQTQTRFWKSPARAHFVNAFDISGACAP